MALDLVHTAKWNPSTPLGIGSWSALGNGVDDVVYAVAVMEGEVYVGGSISGRAAISRATAAIYREQYRAVEWEYLGSDGRWSEQ